MSPPKDVKALIRARVRQARTESGWTQKELASRLGLSSNVSVARYESGDRDVDVATLARIAELTGRSLAWFVGVGEPWQEVEEALLRVRAAEEALRSARLELERALGVRRLTGPGDWRDFRDEALRLWMGQHAAALEGRNLRQEDLTQEMIDAVARRLWERQAAPGVDPECHR